MRRISKLVDCPLYLWCICFSGGCENRFQGQLQWWRLSQSSRTGNQSAAQNSWASEYRKIYIVKYPDFPFIMYLFCNVTTHTCWKPKAFVVRMRYLPVRFGIVLWLRSSWFWTLSRRAHTSTSAPNAVRTATWLTTLSSTCVDSQARHAHDVIKSHALSYY